MAESLPLDTPVAPNVARAPYTAPSLEALGDWSALTLQQTIPISPNIQELILVNSW